MGERIINPIQNIHTSKKYKEVIFINPYSFGGGSDADAQAFITAAGITDPTQQSAITQLVKDLKSANIWTKYKAIYPFVGGTASSHKWNLKDPRDLNAAFRLVFYNSPTHSASGVAWNGSNQYASTFLIPSSSLTLNNTHISYYSRDNITSGSDMGTQNDGASQNLFIIIKLGNNQVYADSYSSLSAEGRINVANPLRADGMWIASRTNSSNFYVARGESVLASTTSSGGTLPAVELTLGRASGLYSARGCSSATIGDGLTTTEAAAHCAAFQAFNTTLGRAITL